MAKRQFTERDLMLLAIEVMNKSINEPRQDGKVPPKVGAVVLFPDGRIVTAYRGELREGDHAEFTLIERKLIHENLAGCVLFTTLEPCVERNPPKVPCCRRTTNARIRKVFVGIEDPDPTVDGKGIKHLERHGVEVKMFDRDLQRLIEAENADFLSQALHRKDLEDHEDLRAGLELPIANYDRSKLSDVALQKFIDESGLTYKLNDQSFWEYLVDFGALTWDTISKNFIPTGFGILLFGKQPRSKFLNAVLKAHVTYAGGKIEPRDFDDALVLIPDQIVEWLLKVLPLAKQTIGFKREDVPNFPIAVLREAVVNALIHRDYELTGAKCEIKIDDEKIVVTSPGHPLPSISLEELSTFDAPSLSRNPILTYVFSQMNYVEEKGFGMKTFKLLNKEHGFPLPKYSFKDPFLTLTFPRNDEAVKDFFERGTIDQLSSRELRAFEIFRTKQLFSKTSFAEKAGLAARTSERFLKRFVDLGLIRVEGSGRSTHYILND